MSRFSWDVSNDVTYLHIRIVGLNLQCHLLRHIRIELGKIRFVSTLYPLSAAESRAFLNICDE